LAKFALFFMLLIGSSCANASLNSNVLDRQIGSIAVAKLAVGKSNLGDCLEILGAPTRVEQSDGGNQFVLSYEWLRNSGWRAGVSVPISGLRNTSVNYSNSDASPAFVKLIFDKEWQLIEVMQG
tara:strand:+ start:752 stop:1123 length:372 start_codon:yes stop_codon:yes gene_type:complete